MKNLIVPAIIIAVIAAGAFIVTRRPKGDTMNIPLPTPVSAPKPPAMEIDVNKRYVALLETSAGQITIELHAKETPVTVNNFVHLAREGFYDNTVFHRVIKGFMIQGGDPRGTGSGGPGYKFDDEPCTGTYTRGTVAMANSGPNTNGSQFFIMHEDNTLDPLYTIFGNVTDGMRTVDIIASAETVQDGRENSKPKDPVTVKSVLIQEM